MPLPDEIMDEKVTIHAIAPRKSKNKELEWKETGQISSREREAAEREKVERNANERNKQGEQTKIEKYLVQKY